MIIAIDHGNYAVKTPHTEFVSGLSEHKVRPPLGDEVLEYAGSFWTLSGKRLPYMRDKTRDERWFVLTLFAIARELETAGKLGSREAIDLAVGLPPEHYGLLRERFAKYFKRGTVSFVYKDKPVSLTICHVLVYPQAYAAVIPQSGELLKTLRVFVVDIGGITTDVLLLRNGKPDLQFCRSLESGVITMNNEIIGKVSAEHDMRVEDEHISAVLLGRDTILTEDVKRTIRTAAEAHARGILDQLGEFRWICARIRPSSSAVAAYCSGLCWSARLWSRNASFVTDPKANAIGYELLASRQLRDMQ